MGISHLFLTLFKMGASVTPVSQVSVRPITMDSGKLISLQVSPMAGTEQPWLFVPEFGQKRDYLNTSSACCRVLSVPEMPPRFYPHRKQPLGTRTFIGPALSQSEAVPTCTAAFTSHPRGALPLKQKRGHRQAARFRSHEILRTSPPVAILDSG